MNVYVRMNSLMNIRMKSSVILIQHYVYQYKMSNQKLNNLFNNSSLKLVYGFAVECRQCQGSINRNELIELVELTRCYIIR